MRSWICTINPEKVKPEIRGPLVAFQDECDQVLYQYWTKGIVVNPKQTISSESKEFLVELSCKVMEQIKESQLQFQAMFQSLVDQMQNQFKFILERLERLESSSNKENMDDFQKFSNIQNMVKDMATHLSEEEQQKYLTSLCQDYKIRIPQPVLEAHEPVFKDLSDIAKDLGLYSLTNKPHASAVGAIIRKLGLDQEKYQRKSYFERNGHQGVTVQYSTRIIPLVYEWLQKLRRLGICFFAVFKIFQIHIQYRQIQEYCIPKIVSMQMKIALL